MKRTAYNSIVWKTFARKFIPFLVVACAVFLLPKFAQATYTVFQWAGYTVNDLTVGKDFDYWRIYYENVSTNQDSCVVVEIKNIDTGSTSYEQGPCATVLVTVGNWSFSKVTDLVDNTRYTFRAYVYDDSGGVNDGQLLFATSPMRVRIESGTNTTYYTASYSINTGQWQGNEVFTCGQTDFQILTIDLGKWACEVGSFLFVPEESNVTDIETAIDDISVKFPFAYVNDVNDAINAVDDTPGEIDSLTLTVDNPSLPLSVPMFSEAKITEYAGEANITLFRGLMASVLWLGLGFFMFNTIKGLH